MFVPVLNENNQPLMPTIPSRARRWIKRGEAVPFWNKGVFCVRLKRKPSSEVKQTIVVGIDPGSKKEGLTVKSAAHTFLNIQADAITHVKKAMDDRRDSRRSRRGRKTPCRKSRYNRKRGGIPPSTKARWQWKLRLLNWLRRMFPITNVVVEDIKAISKKGKRQWNKNFSPLQAGKNWFYEEIRKNYKLDLVQGWETKNLRDQLGLTKTKNKLAEVFEAHCIDSWVLANSIVGGHKKPDNVKMIGITTIILHRRELHRRKPSKGGIRFSYGGTRSQCFKRGSIVRHNKHGIVYIGGSQKDRISLHNLKDGKRLCQNAKTSDIKFLTYTSWRTWLCPN